MARPIRVEFEGAVYHVTARGNERRAIYRDDGDRERFLEAVGQCVEQFGVIVHAYCLMVNHYHLLVETPRGNLSRSLGWLQTTYSIRFNRRHSRSGHLFQGRYKAIVVEADEYAKELIRYIHLNPVRPRDKRKPVPAERRKDLARYPWSSHRAYSGNRKPPQWLCLDWLSYWGIRRKQAQQSYRKDIACCFGDVVRNPMSDLRQGIALTGESLWEDVRRLIDHKGGQEEIRWKQLIGDLAVRAKVCECVASIADKRLQIWARLRLAAERAVDLSREYGYRDGSGVLRVAQRLEHRSRGDKQLARQLSGIRKKMELANVKR